MQTTNTPSSLQLRSIGRGGQNALDFARQHSKTTKYHKDILQNHGIEKSSESDPKLPAPDPQVSNHDSALESKVSIEPSMSQPDEISPSESVAGEHIGLQYWCNICSEYVSAIDSNQEEHEASLKHGYNFQELRSRVKDQALAENHQNPYRSTYFIGEDYQRRIENNGSAEILRDTEKSPSLLGSIDSYHGSSFATGEEVEAAFANVSILRGSQPREQSEGLTDGSLDPKAGSRIVASLPMTSSEAPESLPGNTQFDLQLRTTKMGDSAVSDLPAETTGRNDETGDHLRQIHSYKPIINPTGVDLLTSVLNTIRRSDCLQAFLDHGVNDLWFPFTRQTLRGLFKVSGDEKLFLSEQEGFLDCEMATPLSCTHNFFEDGEEVLRSDRTLGEGGFAIVEQILLPDGVVCVRKRIGRSRQFKAQKQLMTAFAREISAMRQVSHRHCVEFLGSYTDLDNVAIILSPVADMDLATLLDLEHLNGIQERVLRQGIGCLCNALLYLHDKKIRHEDLKPQNILVHGENVLLTDFGFRQVDLSAHFTTTDTDGSLDFSDDSISTTTGRPMHWTARYSAPETMDHQPRNRATDIWGLGCILFEMLARLYGHRLSTMRLFWKQNGNGHPSYALNEDALSRLTRNLWQEMDLKHRALLELLFPMLHTNRFLRPNCQQVVDKLADLHTLFPHQPTFAGDCCAYEPQRQSNILLKRTREVIIEKHMPLPPAYYYGRDSNFTALYADTNFNIIGYEDSERFPLPKPEPGRLSPAGNCRDLFGSDSSTHDITDLCIHLMNKAPFDTLEQSEKNLAMEDALDECTISAIICPMKDMVLGSFREPFKSQLSGFDVYPDWRLVHLTLMPVCLPRSPYFGAWFFRLSFMIDERKPHPYGLEYEEWIEEMLDSGKPSLDFEGADSSQEWTVVDDPPEKDLHDERSDTREEMTVEGTSSEDPPETDMEAEQLPLPLLSDDRHVTFSPKLEFPFAVPPIVAFKQDYGNTFKVYLKPGQLKAAGYEEDTPVFCKVVWKRDGLTGEKMLREVEAIRARKHKNIVPLFASFTAGYPSGSQFHLEYLHLLFPISTTIDMKAWLKSSNTSEPLSNDYSRRGFVYSAMEDLARGLAFIHSELHGFVSVHHALKPSNILLFEEGLGSTWKISNFHGPSMRVFEAEVPRPTMTNELDMYEYQPPEYLSGDRAGDIKKHGRSFDVYSLGCIYLELATIILYGWVEEGLPEFERQRAANTVHDYYGTSKKTPDLSFHNNRRIVDLWIIHLKELSRNGRTYQLLELIRKMLGDDDQRIKAWEVQNFLYSNK